MKKEHILKYYILLLLMLSAFLSNAQTETYYVNSIKTDAGYAANEDSSAISRNTNTQLNKLYLFIGGTGSSSSKDYNALRLHAAKLGFDFINLSYPNSVAAASLKNNTDSLTFNKYRQEVCFGTPGSDDVNIDSFNSIYTRTLKLLKYLESTHPSENWGQYLAGANAINWSKIIVGGHSQGAGHAAFLAKQFLVDRALMFSGPNDYSDHFSSPANWLKKPGITPITRHFAYLSLNDEIAAFSKQFANLFALGMLINEDTTHIDDNSPPYTNSRFLYTTQSPGIVLLHHNATVKFGSPNEDVWNYMLTSSISTGLFNHPEKLDLSVFPNPSTTALHLKSSKTLIGKSYTLNSITGQTILSKVISSTDSYSIDISDIISGIYFLRVDDYTFKIVKQ